MTLIAGRTAFKARRLAIAVAITITAGAVAFVCAPRSALAQRPATAGDEAVAAQSYLNPFPEGDVYKLQVFGDGFAEGLLAGVADAFEKEPRVQVQRKHKPIGALVRSDWEDDVKPEETSRDVVHIGVVMLGISDRQSIRPTGGGRSIAMDNEEWNNEYGRRLDRWIKALKKRSIALYIVGQPALRRSEAQTQAEQINEVLRERAYLNGVRFIDVMEPFQDETGSFSQFGPDLAGNRQKLREGDGVTFTSVGNRKLAHFVEREIRRDMQQAAVDRTVPLAGSEAEQRKISPSKLATTGATALPGQKASLTISGRGGAAQAVAGQAAASDGSLDQKADNGRVTLKAIGASGREEQIAIDIVRPAIPASVISLLARREVAERVIQPAEALSDELANGMAIVHAVSTIGDATGGSGQRRRSATAQSPYYAVLVKGDRLQTKPGRADDFNWPRTDAVAPPEPAQRPTPAAAATGGPPVANKGAGTPQAKARAQQR